MKNTFDNRINNIFNGIFNDLIIIISSVGEGFVYFSR